MGIKIPIGRTTISTLEIEFLRHNWSHVRCCLYKNIPRSVCYMENHLASPNLSFPHCKMGLFQGYCKDKMELYTKFLAYREPGTQYVKVKSHTQPEFHQ